MRSSPIFVSLAGLALTSQAASIAAREPDACGQITEKALKHEQQGTNSTFYVPGELAHQCLKALPFESKRAAKFVQEYRKYLQYQSTIELLKNPPGDYQMPAVDLLGGLDKIEKQAAAGKYNSQYDFDNDISDLISSAFDGHLSVELCSQVSFTFENKFPLVSVSSNGTTLPEVYTSNDANLLANNRGRVSPVTSINGVDVDDYLVNSALNGQSQDYDALYNVAVYNPVISIDALGEPATSVGKFNRNTKYPGANQTLHFANGTKTVADTVVRIAGFNATSAKHAYQKFCIPASKSASSSSVPSSTTTPSSTPKASASAAPTPKSLRVPSVYPEPHIRDPYNRILGFFPKSEGLQDTAVLAIPSFNTGTLGGLPLPQSESRKFDLVAQQLILNATAQGKKKMIVDLSGNTGGTINTGLNLFRLFFPREEVYSATRFRAHDSANLIGKVLDQSPEEAGSLYWNYEALTTPDQNGTFESWKDLYGANDVLGVPSSNVFAQNFTVFGTDENPINGFANKTLTPSKAPFDAKDIVLITDGICASTCTIFTELMKKQGVRTIAFGGRPKNAPMQGMGGVKGSQVQALSDLSDVPMVVTELLKGASAQGIEPLTKDELQRLNNTIVTPLEEFPLTFKGGNINIVNAFSPTNHRLPRQFIYEAAECRRFFTAKNIFHRETAWASAADAMFHNGGCVPGSTNGAGSLRITHGAGHQRLM